MAKHELSLKPEFYKFLQTDKAKLLYEQLIAEGFDEINRLQESAKKVGRDGIEFELIIARLRHDLVCSAAETASRIDLMAGVSTAQLAMFMSGMKDVT